MHGAAPTFIAASATVADPRPTAARLLGVDAEVVDVDDSARGAVDIVLWNPQEQPSATDPTIDPAPRGGKEPAGRPGVRRPAGSRRHDRVP